MVKGEVASQNCDSETISINTNAIDAISSTLSADTTTISTENWFSGSMNPGTQTMESASDCSLSSLSLGEH